MAETLALAVGVPAALGAVWLASRRSWMPAFRDVRGIALQTVIVIVVMLVIAGGVAGVLLSRGSDVITDLETQDVAAVNAGNCAVTPLNGINGTSVAPAGVNTEGGCTWTGTATQQITATTCNSLRGSSNGGANSLVFEPAGDAVSVQAVSATNIAIAAIAAGMNVGGYCALSF